MNYDGYGEVINGPDTFKTIAADLKDGNPVLVGWTDENMTHFDVLMNLGALVYGTPQGGVTRRDLFVSVMRRGAFGFEPLQQTHAGYYEEKLGGHLGSTAEKLAELINGVKSNL